MKINVTYEKDDIIRLVKEDLERRGLRLKPGAQPEYKGALQVKLSIEAMDEDVPPPPPPLAPPSPKASEGDEPAPAEEDGDMEAVLRSSQHVAATTRPTFKLAENDQPLKRSLGVNESLDFPRE